MDKREDTNEENLRRRYYERLSDWSEPGAVKIIWNGKPVDPLAELRKRIFQVLWNRPKR
jgi:hypothetical protein